MQSCLKTYAILSLLLHLMKLFHLFAANKFQKNLTLYVYYHHYYSAFGGHRATGIALSRAHLANIPPE